MCTQFGAYCDASAPVGPWMVPPLAVMSVNVVHPLIAAAASCAASAPPSSCGLLFEHATRKIKVQVRSMARILLRLRGDEHGAHHRRVHLAFEAVRPCRGERHGRAGAAQIRG